MDLRFVGSRRWYVVVVVALRSELFLATREGASQRGAYYCTAADSCAPAGQQESLLQVVQPQLHRGASSRSSSPGVSELFEKAAVGDVERSEGALWEPKRAAVVELEFRKADVSASRRQDRGGAGAHAVAGHLGPLWPMVGLVQAVGLIWQWCDSALPNVLHSYSAPASDPYYSLPSSSPAGEAAAAAAAATPESPAWTLMLLATRVILQVVSITATILMIWCAIPCFCSLLTRRKRREWAPAMWIPPDFVEEDTLGENPVVAETPSQLDIDVLALNSLYS